MSKVKEELLKAGLEIISQKHLEILEKLYIQNPNAFYEFICMSVYCKKNTIIRLADIIEENTIQKQRPEQVHGHYRKFEKRSKR